MREIGNRVRQRLYADRWLLLTALLAAIAVHYQIWANGLQNPDSYWIGQVYQADHWNWLPHWETMQGRWGLWMVDAARGSLNNPVLTALPMLVCYTLAGALLVDLFRLRGSFARLIGVLLVTCAPAVAAVESYRYCCASYGLSFLLAVLAVYCVVRGTAYPRLSVAAAAVCLVFSLSLYQTGLSVAAGLSLLVLLQKALTRECDTTLLRRLLGMGIGGTAVYYFVYKLLLWTGGLRAAGYGGADQFGVGNILANLKHGVRQAYTDFFDYYLRHTVAANGFGGCAVAALLLLLGCAAILWQLWKLHDGKAAAWALACVVLLPLAVNITGVLLPGNTLLLRTAGGLLPILPFLLAQVQAAWPRCPQHICGGAALLLAVLALRGYALQVNTDAAAMQAYKNQHITVMRQIAAEVTAMPEYKTAESLAIIGRLPSDNYPLQPTLPAEADPFATDTVFWGMASSDRVAWINGFDEELGLQPNFCTEQQYVDIMNSPEFGAMPCYPDRGSVQMLDGVLVVKVS